MGFIRGSFIVILSIVLFLSLIIGNVFLTASFSLDYENIKSEIAPIIKEMLEEQTGNNVENLDESLEEMQIYCEDNSEFSFSDDDSEYSGTIPCEIIAQGSGAIIEYQLNSFLEEQYYKEYTCEFWDCVKENNDPFVLFSQKAQDYWKGKFYLMLLVSIILAILIILFMEKRTNWFFVVGGLIIVSALPFIKLGTIVSKIFSGSMLLDGILDVFASLLNNSISVFWTMLIIGLVIIFIGFGFKAFHFGIKIHEFAEWIKEKFSKNE